MADPTAIQISMMFQILQTENYFATVAGAIVAYDHVLASSQEIDYIWNRRWSFMTALYLIARYSGSLSTIGLAALYICINWTYPGYLNMYMAVTWAETIFLLTMQAILVIRVYALFNQSKKVLIFLTTFYVLQAITVFVMTALLFNDQVIPKYMTSISPAFGSVAQILTFNPPEFFLAVAHDSTIVSVVFDIVLLLLALWAFVRHALEAKASDGRWSINALVRTLMADHLVYFICNLIWLSLSLASGYVTAANTEWLDGALYVFNALVVVAGPRMVISLRAMENKTRGEGETLEVELSAIRVGIRELSTQSESVMEEGDF